LEKFLLPSLQRITLILTCRKELPESLSEAANIFCQIPFVTGAEISLFNLSCKDLRINESSHESSQTHPSLVHPLTTQDRNVGELRLRFQELPDQLYGSMNALVHIVGALLLQRLQLLNLIEEKRSSLQNESSEETETRFHPANMVGNAKSMQGVYEHISQVASSDTSVLISGASGVGKELVANAIHHNSPRASKPFIKVNCAALPETLLESELFGHERGSFTGAIQQKKGRFELANGGTLFLDEVGDFSPATQVKLLRVLQEREFERLGGTTTLRTNVRIIAATNRDLQELISEGKFRQDLYYRLHVFPIFVPPLRDRKTDILLLADHFVEKYNRLLHKNVRRISTPAIDMLMSYHWPGNVRELENCIERAILLSKDDVLHGHHLPSSLQTAEASGTLRTDTLPGALNALEREMLIDVLKNSRGNTAQAARALGLSERKMGLRVKKHKIDPRRFRQISNEKSSSMS
jgi:Nif-specific regulatory protein